MKKEKCILEEKESKEINQMLLCMNNAMRDCYDRIDELEDTLKTIKKISERNQYGNPEVAFRLIQEKINEVL